MSYILDALRKAESDRKLGETVGVHDPSPMPASGLAAEAPAWQRWLPAIMLAGLLALGLTLAWLMWGSRATATQAPVATAGSPTKTDVSAMPAKGTSPTAHSSDDVVQIPQPFTHDRPPPVASPPPNEPTSPKGQAVSQDAGAAIRLTPDLRASLPPLAVGGAMYSDTPASRMVVINGQLFHEGDTVAPEVTLEAVQLKSAIIRYRGQLYLLDY